MRSARFYHTFFARRGGPSISTRSESDGREALCHEVECHSKANKARLESVPPRARPSQTRRCIETNTVRESALLNHRVIGLPPHNPNNRPGPF